MTIVKRVREHFDGVNLGDYDLEGVEFTEDDFSTISERVEKGCSVEAAVHSYLLEIREVLDAGLEEA